MKKRQRAYQLRNRFRVSWLQIAKMAGYKHATTACAAAFKYARDNNLDLPASVLSEGEFIYLARMDGESWEEITEAMSENGILTVWSVKGVVWKYCDRKGLDYEIIK
jgi:hypothetical protein|tara:strand:- start:1318 stop:1638 length:321 start_codon:yes stop_codon:yes gene_type:complete